MRSFSAFVDDEGRLSIQAPRLFREALKAFRGKDVWISVDEHRRKRTTNQNSYLHAEPFPKLAKAMGCSVSQVKVICMGAFWGWEPVEVNGQRYMLPVKVHTSDMTVEQCTTFIDWLLPWAVTEHGVEIRTPDEWEGRVAA